MPSPFGADMLPYDGSDDSLGGQDDQGWNDDAALSWYWLGTRPYDPRQRRFLQPDPAKQGGLPAYMYANSDPLPLIWATLRELCGGYTTLMMSGRAVSRLPIRLATDGRTRSGWGRTSGDGAGLTPVRTSTL